MKPWEKGFVPITATYNSPPVTPKVKTKPVVIDKLPVPARRGPKKVSFYSDAHVKEMAAISATEKDLFEKLYVTSSEICEKYHIARTVLHDAQMRGLIPVGITVANMIVIWRREHLAPYLQRWLTHLYEIRTKNKQ